MSDALICAAAMAVLGAIIGSFVATLVIRWPQGRSVMTGRSACDVCGRNVLARDLVPLLSFVGNRGRCRTCGGVIDPRHWQIELLCAGVAALAGLVAPWPVALAGAIFGWLLVALATIDVAEFWLPDPLTATLAASGLATGALGIAPPIGDRLIGGALGFGVLWLIGFGYKRLRGREGLGGGDPKLFGAIGLWLGWGMLPVVLFLASLVGLGVALFARMTGREVALDTRMPFGALLAVAAYPAWLVMIGSMP